MFKRNKAVIALVAAGLVAVPFTGSARTWWSLKQKMNVFADSHWTAAARNQRGITTDADYSGFGRAQVDLPAFEADAALNMYIWNPGGRLIEVLNYDSNYDPQNNNAPWNQ